MKATGREETKKKEGCGGRWWNQESQMAPDLKAELQLGMIKNN